ncbi:MAG: CbiX/SirB N-terminal domain-containing protein [Candidatus Thiodiazotropha sp. 6PLUC2]
MNRPIILLADNGSAKAGSVVNLRKLAQQMSDHCQQQVYPVSLQHAQKIPVEDLAGKPADTLHPFLRQKLIEGERSFLLIPLFFGLSRALTAFIPQQVDLLKAEFGEFKLIQGEVLCPLPQGEPRVAKIVFDQIQKNTNGEKPQQIVVVDHGSPLPQVNAVRKRITRDLRNLVGADVPIAEAAMERRTGAEYDFNGELLEDELSQIAELNPQATVDLAQLFLSPGRHAGPGGDIEQICERVNLTYPRLKIRIAQLVGQHDDLADILCDRLNSALANKHD